MELQYIKKIILEYHDFIQSIELKRRYFPIETQANYVIIGPRRAGKTYYLYQLIQEFCERGNKIEDIVFLNFEDERFMEFRHQDFDSILQAYRELFDKKPILFFDEIHIVAGWEKFVRRLADTGYRVYVSGSNAQMLSSDIATTLGGRFMVKEILPLSFREYLAFQNFSVAEQDLLRDSKVALIKRFYRKFFYSGAFPETLLFAQSQDYLRNLYQKLLYGDIMLRHEIRNDTALKLLVKKLAESVGDESSYRRITNLVKATGVKISPDTIIDYLSYLKDAYLIFSLQNFASKFSERESKKKYYFMDNGFLNLFLLEGNSFLLENLAYLELYRRYAEEIYFYRDTYEIDFYLPETASLIQVSYSLRQPETRKREVRALLSVSKKIKAESFLILTHEEEYTIEESGKKIEVKPMWKWLLES